MYRIWQFWKTLTGRLSPTEWEEIQEVLTPDQMVLFQKMGPSDQAHCYRVMTLLREEGYTEPDVLAGALLHDAGKSEHPLRFWERPLPVLFDHFFPEHQSQSKHKSPHGWRRALVIAEHHPRWGARLAARAGASDLTVWLIQNHQQPDPQDPPHPQAEAFLKALKKADNQC